MDDEVLNSRNKFKRQRFLSYPSIESDVANINKKVARKHRQSQIEGFICEPRLMKTSISEPGENNSKISKEIGVKAFDMWTPRKYSKTTDDVQSIASRATFTLKEERVLTEMNVDTKRVIENKSDSIIWYKVEENPFKSNLFLRVLYLIGSTESDDETHDTNIKNQFLTEEQIMEDQLKEQRDGVERMKHELACGDTNSSKSGTVTPVEFIYQTIIKRNSSPNLKKAAASFSNLIAVEKVESSKSSLDDTVDHHLDAHNCRNKGSHKLTGREKSMLAPLTF